MAKDVSDYSPRRANCGGGTCGPREFVMAARLQSVSPYSRRDAIIFARFSFAFRTFREFRRFPSFREAPFGAFLKRGVTFRRPGIVDNRNVDGKCVDYIAGILT